MSEALNRRNQAQADVKAGNITPAEYWRILNDTYYRMTPEERRAERLLLRERITAAQTKGE